MNAHILSQEVLKWHVTKTVIFIHFDGREYEQYSFCQISSFCNFFVTRHFKLEKERMDLVNWIGQQVTNWPLWWHNSDACYCRRKKWRKKRPGTGPIKILHCKFYAMQFFKHFDWLKIISIQSKCLKNREA